MQRLWLTFVAVAGVQTYLGSLGGIAVRASVGVSFGVGGYR